MVPAALTTSGPASRNGYDSLCLHAGATAEVNLWVHEPTLSLTITAAAKEAPKAPLLAIRLGGTVVADQAMEASAGNEHTFRIRPQQGLQPLLLAAPDANAVPVCIRKIAIAQP